jgi:hypothetical protein
MVVVAGCSKSPVSEYEASKSALEEAKVAEAAQYVPELLTIATDSLNAAEVDMAMQDGKFALLRDYDRSAQLIATAKKLALEARDVAVVKKEETRLLDSALIVEIESLITETKSILAKAPKGKGSRVDLKVIQADIDASTSALAAASGEVQAGRYLVARDRLNAIKTQVAKIKNDIATASTKVSNK